MVLSDISIKRPVFATVVSLVLVLFGLFAFERLAIREYPDIDPPTVSVITLYKGPPRQTSLGRRRWSAPVHHWGDPDRPRRR